VRHRQNLPRNLILIASITCIALLQGCATVVSGVKDTVEVTSEPPGALVRLEKNGKEYTTPASFEVTRRSSHTMLVSRDGYHTERVTIGRTLNPWLFGNLIFGGVVGIVVDFVSGATFSPSPGKAHIELAPLGPGETAEIRDWIPPHRRKAPKEEPRITEAAPGRRAAAN